MSGDYKELFSTLNTYKIKYLVVGAHAVMFYAEPRFTKDLDVWVQTASSFVQHFANSSMNKHISFLANRNSSGTDCQQYRIL